MNRPHPQKPDGPSPRPFLHVPQTGSTNQDLVEIARSGQSEPVAILTDHQSAGRGRLGRTWHDDAAKPGTPQAMLGSSRVDWAAGDPSMALMPFAAGLAGASACDRWTDQTSVVLKWPNDLVVQTNGSSDSATGWFRKLGGVLVEALPLQGTSTVAAIIGIGINVLPILARTDAPLEAISVSELSTTPPSTTELFEAVLDELDRWVGVLRSNPADLMNHYRER